MSRDGPASGQNTLHYIHMVWKEKNHLCKQNKMEYFHLPTITTSALSGTSEGVSTVWDSAATISCGVCSSADSGGCSLDKARRSTFNNLLSIRTGRTYNISCCQNISISLYKIISVCVLTPNHCTIMCFRFHAMQTDGISMVYFLLMHPLLRGWCVSVFVYWKKWG